MNIEEIKALYKKRDEAYSALETANAEIESAFGLGVRRVARKVMILRSGDKNFWHGYNNRLKDEMMFDPEKKVFTIIIESYAGEGNWCAEFDEDGDEERACVRVPVRWLEMNWDDVEAEILAVKAAKEALERKMRDARIEEKAKEQEAKELAELARLNAKYKEKK